MSNKLIKQKSYTEFQVRKMVAEAYKKGQQDAITDSINENSDSVLIKLLGLPCKVLYDKYGWKHLTTYANHLVKAYQEFEDSDIALDELSEWVWEECGIKFVED